MTDNVTQLYDGTDNAFADICDAVYEIAQKYQLSQEELYYSLRKYVVGYENEMFFEEWDEVDD